MKILTIPKYEKNLRQKSKEFDIKLIHTPESQKFFSRLSATMLKADGVGLAAPQVNKLIRVIAVNINQEPRIFINPKITKKSWTKDIMEEGCLSVPNVYGKVKRHKKIKLEYFNSLGEFHKQKFSQLTARIIQHEVDHLDGILFIDKTIS